MKPDRVELNAENKLTKKEGGKTESRLLFCKSILLAGNDCGQGLWNFGLV